MKSSFVDVGSARANKFSSNYIINFFFYSQVIPMVVIMGGLVVSFLHLSIKNYNLKMHFYFRFFRRAL